MPLVWEDTGHCHSRTPWSQEVSETPWGPPQLSSLTMTTCFECGIRQRKRWPFKLSTHTTVDELPGYPHQPNTSPGKKSTSEKTRLLSCSTRGTLGYLWRWEPTHYLCSSGTKGKRSIYRQGG
ncbi:predicted protein [Chaetomium globosum CBS 148.51]|uniref:Uncharacterized protein n=1 Tax=Chaetomium globosum (strain ATCC 6205 / CBS 148.51 / DSM 1962 / NBRC 6347 / NRRL 1970) TaxID=306901 RepID=Q2GTJ8_CHAGB|nr:uncharacterized protein CHGG_08706 [Chaetomium globosum CBS 148.51]EAQ84692.1 predicted protein [Chaetomium globosum CBS 148.51]